VEKTNENSVNLNKYISSTGICSRREAEKFITEGCVTINGEIAQLGNRVFEGDVVKINGKSLNTKPKTLYIAFNKPVGIVCTTDLKERKNIVNKILRAGNNHEKEYIVSVRQPITSAFIQKMGGGLPILDTVTKKCEVTKLNDYTFKIVLTQGLNRQIRRMCDYLNYEVTSLKRTRIMNINLEGIKVGEWRELTEKEMAEINKMISDSSKTEEASMDVHKKK
jgi:23S rRNA pseudouridine2604 synthase